MTPQSDDLYSDYDSISPPELSDKNRFHTKKAKQQPLRKNKRKTKSSSNSQAVNGIQRRRNRRVMW